MTDEYESLRREGKKSEEQKELSPTAKLLEALKAPEGPKKSLEEKYSPLQGVKRDR